MRDLLLEQRPKDFDIATAARPQQVKRCFPRNCRIIGRRFKLAHLHFNHNQKILEVATFRRMPVIEDEDDLLILRDNVFGTAEEDARRRDFTVNALFHDPIEDRLIDYVDGLDDLDQRLLRTIGDPEVRFREDPVRILRLAKFAGRLGLHVEPKTFEAVKLVAPDLARGAPPRLLEEILRLLRAGHALESFQLLRDFGAISVLLPVVGQYLESASKEERILFWRLLEAVDAKTLDEGEVPSAVLLGALFTRTVTQRAAQHKRRSATTIAEELLGPFCRDLRLPRRDAGCLKRICGVQQRFTARGGTRFKTSSFLRDPYFAEALELFELICSATGRDRADFQRWQELAREGAEGTDGAPPAAAARVPDVAETRVEDPTAPPAPRKRRRRRRRSGRGGEEGPARTTADADTPAKEPGAKAKPSRSRRGAGAARSKAASKKTERAQPRPRKAKTTSRTGKGPGRKRSRQATVKTIEPEAIDLSAFDIELDPRRVPSFGSLVESDPKSKGKTLRTPPIEEEDTYKPPKPVEAPPQEREDDDKDVFGDW